MPDPEYYKHLARFEDPKDIRFITFSCEQRLPLMGNPAIRDVFVDCLGRMRARYAVEVFAAVVMPEHAHLLVRPKDGKLALPLRGLKTAVAKRVMMRWQELDAPILDRLRRTRVHEEHGDAVSTELRFWQKGGGFDRNVRSIVKFCETVQYIHRNPVERGLVSEPTDWKWSTLGSWMGLRGVGIECDPPPGRPGDWSLWKGYV